MTEPTTPLARALRALMASPILLLVLCNIFWGGNVVAGKAAVGNIDPYALMVLRWAGSLLLLLPFVAGPLQRDWPVLRARWWLYLFYGAVGYASFNALCYVAAYFTSGVNIGLDQVAINIFVMAFNFALFRTRVRGLQLIGVALTILGVALTATHGELSRILALDINFGDLLVILASLAYAIYSIGLRWRPQTSWLSFLFASFLGGPGRLAGVPALARWRPGAFHCHPPRHHPARLAHRRLYGDLPLADLADVLRPRRRADRAPTAPACSSI